MNKTIYNWFVKKEALEVDLSTATIVKFCILIIPIHGILYLSTFYQNFGITYFMYFNPVDFLTVFYANNVSLLQLLLAMGFVPIFLRVFYRNKQDNLFSYNLILSSALLVSLILTVSLIIHNPYLSKSMFMLLVIMSCAIVFIALSKKISIIFPSFVIIYLLFIIFLAKFDAYSTKISKPNFDIILNDNSYLLKQNKINHSSYFIGNITNYIFIYDADLKKVRAISTSNVKEIRFDYK